MCSLRHPSDRPFYGALLLRAALPPFTGPVHAARGPPGTQPEGCGTSAAKVRRPYKLQTMGLSCQQATCHQNAHCQLLRDVLHSCQQGASAYRPVHRTVQQAAVHCSAVRCAPSCLMACCARDDQLDMCVAAAGRLVACAALPHCSVARSPTGT